jgi:predicted nucleotidyltransferase
MAAQANESSQLARLSDPLALLGVSRSQCRIIRYFALRARIAIHGRALQRILHLGTASLRRDLENLVALGALRRRQVGRRVVYQADLESPLWSAFGTILAATSDPSTLVRDALSDVAGIDAAFVFGSTATDARREDSDIDLMVLEGAHIDRRALFSRLAEVALLLDIEVNTLRYTAQSLAERLGNPDHPGRRFVRSVLAGPKRWVAGDPQVLCTLAAAAGIRVDRPDAA